MKNTINELYWVANYIDGSKLTQYEGVTGFDYEKENKYADIDRDRLNRFDLIKTETGKPVYSVYVHEGQKLIYRRRTLRPVIPTPQNPVTIIYLVGYQMNIMTNSGIRNFIVINYIHEDGSIALDGPRNNLQLLPLEF